MAATATKKARFLHLSFDAFGTLFRPVPSVAEQYAAVAKQHGIEGFSAEDLNHSFTTAYKAQAKEYPVYGKGTLNAKAWWGRVIRATFDPHLTSNQKLPQEIVETLWHRFATKEAYQKYDDVDSFFKRLMSYRRSPSSLTHSSDGGNPPSAIMVSILSNYDKRLPNILRDLNIGGEGVGFIMRNPIYISHGLGIEKPNVAAFDHVRTNVQHSFWRRHCQGQDGLKCRGSHHYIGDDYKNDFVGAAKAGWVPYHLDRAGKFNDLIPDGQDYVVLDREVVWERSGNGEPVKPCPKEVSVLRNLNALLDGGLVHADRQPKLTAMRPKTRIRTVKV